MLRDHTKVKVFITCHWGDVRSGEAQHNVNQVHYVDYKLYLPEGAVLDLCLCKLERDLKGRHDGIVACQNKHEPVPVVAPHAQTTDDVPFGSNRFLILDLLWVLETYVCGRSAQV